MGQVLDIVPNHMGITRSLNPWWMDVLENGPSSLYASYFDIDWTPAKDELANKVLLPILGDQYGLVLENQELTLQYEEGPSSCCITTTGCPSPHVRRLRHPDPPPGGFGASAGC